MDLSPQELNHLLAVMNKVPVEGLEAQANHLALAQKLNAELQSASNPVDLDQKETKDEHE